jgi:hypothetical protein
MSPFGTNRRLSNICVDGGYLGQTGPDMPDARLSQFDRYCSKRFRKLAVELEIETIEST